jgi:hypothetical protein
MEALVMYLYGHSLKDCRTACFSNGKVFPFESLVDLYGLAVKYDLEILKENVKSYLESILPDRWWATTQMMNPNYCETRRIVWALIDAVCSIRHDAKELRNLLVICIGKIVDGLLDHDELEVRGQLLRNPEFMLDVLVYRARHFG